MKVAVVGGGIFGATAALFAARAGHDVSLYEKLDSLLKAASGINQYRLHRGYHYPRSRDTAKAAMHAEASFQKEFQEAVIQNGDHYYAIAKEKSFVTGDDFIKFCESLSLGFTKEPFGSFVSPDTVELFLKVQEAWFDPLILKKTIEEKLFDAKVKIHLRTSVTQEDLDGYEKVIVATYANLNEVVPDIGAAQEYQFEICEKPVVQMPENFDLSGIVVMDGPFMCVDPFGSTGQFVLGNVVHAIHSSNIGLLPEIPETLKNLMNQGVVKNPPITHFDKFIEHGARYIPMLGNAKHVGSMFTVRTVLPKQEKTDARPTLVTAIDEKYIRIFSGKIGNCVSAAEQATQLL